MQFIVYCKSGGELIQIVIFRRFISLPPLLICEMCSENPSLQAIKEELEEMIEQVKEDVDKKDNDIVQIKRGQDKSFDLLSFKMERLQEDFKALGIDFMII